MTLPAGMFYVLLLFASIDDPGQVYDAKFQTIDECFAMMAYHATGINGDFIGGQCELRIEL